jgi:hypothetical protein
LTNLGRSPHRGEVGREGEKTDSPGRSRPLSATRRRERDRPEMFGVIGDTTRGRDGRRDGAGVNYRGLNVREKKVWLRDVATFERILHFAPAAIATGRGSAGLRRYRARNVRELRYRVPARRGSGLGDLQSRRPFTLRLSSPARPIPPREYPRSALARLGTDSWQHATPHPSRCRSTHG